MRARQFYYGAMGTLGVLVAAGIGGYYYASTLIHQKTTVLQMRLATDEAIATQLNQLVDLKNAYEKYKPVVPQIQAALPKSKKQSEVALQLQQLAGAAGMRIPSVTFTAPKDLPTATSQTIIENGVLALPIVFQMNGTYPQLQAFLHSVENLNRYSGVSSLTISRKDVKSEILTFDIEVKVYIKP